MAGKSVKRAKVDAQLSNDVSKGLRMACDGSNAEPTRASGDHSVDALTTQIRQEPDVVEKIQLELDTATKCIEQLRREKDYEVRRVRDEEQARLSTALTDLESRLKSDGEKAREALKSRMECDANRLSGRYERTIKKLSGDLDKCRNELREEIEKRGMSSSTRGSFEAERVRLLTEVRDLKAVKRRLEERIESAAEVDKQKTAEVKRTQEACQAEISKMSKEANAEIRKLLDELKTKDHQLALLDRNQYPDRGASLPKQATAGTENQANEQEVPPTIPPKPVKPTAPAVSEAEAVAGLKRDLEKLSDKLSKAESERNRLRARVDELCLELAQRSEIISDLRKRETKASSSEQKPKSQPKAVRFLLPGCTLPVLAREIEVASTTQPYDDDNASVTSDMSCSSLSSVLSPDTTALFDENLEKNYHILLAEHLNLQRSIAVLLSSWTGSTSPPSTAASVTTIPSLTSSVSESDDSKKEQLSCTKDCIIEKDALKVVIGTLEQKLRKLEQDEELLKQQLQENAEQNEELEFRVLELEECAEKCKMAHSDNAAEELFEKMRGLENELISSKDLVNYYHKLEKDSACGDFSLGDYIDLIKHRQLDAEGRSEMLRLEVMALKRKMEGPVRYQPEVPKLGQKSGTTKIELPCSDADSDDLLSICPMNCSMSTTSGYDDDSCASSVADMKLDELPSEEAWGLEDDDDVTRADDAIENYQSTEQTGSEFNDSKTSSTKDTVPSETVKKLEQTWLARIEAMETRLAQAMQSEQRARDQVALVGEEKDRRIAALQKQVDMLEENDFRLAETIQSLERLEVTFSQLTASSSSPSSSECSRNPSVSDEEAPTTDAIFTIEIENEDRPSDSILQSELFTEHRCAAFGDGCIQCEAGRVLKNSLEKLRSARCESETLDERLKELSEAMNGETEQVPPSSLLIEAVPDDEGIVDFNVEYRELEILVKELRKVLLIDTDNSHHERDEINTNEPEVNGCDGRGIAIRPVGFLDPMTQSWSTVASESCLYSLPNSPAFDLQSPVIGLLRERCREYDLNEQQLSQQVANLERERDALRETVEGSETAIRELSIQVLDLQASESSLRDEVDRLRTKKDWISGRNDELMELIGRLEGTVDQHRSTELEYRSRIDRHAASEAELGRELEDARDEALADEARYRKWVRQLEDERTALQRTNDDLSERNVDLESREAGLLCRIKRLETAEAGLKNDVIELERALDEAGRTASVDVQSVAIQTVIDVESESIQTSTQTEADITETGNDGDMSYTQLKERAEFFKEMLEFCEQSNTALEAKLTQCVDSEKVLRGIVAEYEQTDKIWQNKVESLESKNTDFMKQISDLEITVAELKTTYGQRQQFTVDDVERDPMHDEYEFEITRQSALSALRGLLLLSDVADDVDDTELNYWAAVEGAATTHCDGVQEDDLSSPIWSAVEARMGLATDDDEIAAIEEQLLNDKERLQTSTLTTETEVRPQQPEEKIVSETKSTALSHSPDVASKSSQIAQATTFNGPAASSTTNGQQLVRFPVPARSRSADLFVTPSSTETSRESRSKRATSESRGLSLALTAPEADSDMSPMSPESSALAGNSVMERIHRSREFWSTKSSEVQPPSTLPVQNGSKRSLIPRIAPSSRSQLNPLKLDEAISLPVIRSVPLSPTPSLDDRNKNNKSYLPRPINDHRSTTEGKEPVEQTSKAEAKATKEKQPGQQATTTKMYTTVLGANRFITTPKISCTSSAVRDGKIAADSKTSANPHSSKTSQLQRPVVRESSSSTDVISKPEVETSLLPVNRRV